MTNYQFTIFVNWLNDVETSEAENTERLKTGTRQKKRFPKSHLISQTACGEAWCSLKPKPNGPIYQNVAKLIQSVDKRNFSSERKAL
jgi:hypothetical protein